jgi:hypothetical protein
LPEGKCLSGFCYKEDYIMQEIKCVYVNCGSSPGVRPEYQSEAFSFGKEVASRGMSLVYGGSNLGLMGAVALGCLEAGGHVTGVIPESLNKKVEHPELSKLIVVKNMHERKKTMFEMADAIVALPGGIGTFEEFLEALTWAQLGYHTKPCGLLNICNYFKAMLDLLEHAVEERFLQKLNFDMVMHDEMPAALLDKLQSYTAPEIEKWLDKQ